MSIQIERREDCRHVKIDGEMTIFTAAELHAELWPLWQEGEARSTEIDLSDVIEFDSAGLQILLVAKACAVRQGGALRLIEHSPAVLDVLELTGLLGHFGDPVLEHGERHEH